MENAAIARREIRKVKGALAEYADDLLAVEEPLEIQLRYFDSGRYLQKSVSVTMRTPGNDAELATGFLFTEGIIQRRDQVKTIASDPLDENKISIVLEDNAEPVLQNTDRNFYTTSSCGVCGKASIDAIKTVSPFVPVDDDIKVAPALICKLPDILRQQQEVFEQTGGLHAAALFDLEGGFVTMREDVGRHNALDKVIGHAFACGYLPLHQVILLLSGRASFELVQKAAMAGIKVIAAVGAPSSLAASLAEEQGITLIGFLRNERFNIYSAAHRIIS
jgi:FdhD protein